MRDFKKKTLHHFSTNSFVSKLVFPTGATWGIGWGTPKSDIAEDVWANEENIYVCGSLEVNTTHSKLFVSKFIQNQYPRGTQVWSVNWTAGTATYGKAIWSNGTYIYTAGEFHNNLVLIKWDENGTQIWNSTWNLGGYFGNVNSIWGINETIYLCGTYINDLLLIQWNDEGIQIWNRTWGGIQWEEGFDVWGENAFVYTCGSTSSYGNGLNDSLIIKWHENGTQIWDSTWGTANEEFHSSIFGHNSSLYVCGNKWDVTQQSNNIFIMKWFINGTWEWKSVINSANNDSANSIWANEYHVYVGGTTVKENEEDGDMLFLKYSYSGQKEEKLSWGTNYHDTGEALYVVNENLYICGMYANLRNCYIRRYFSYDSVQPPNFLPLTPNPSPNGTVFIQWEEIPDAQSYNLYKDIHPILDISNRTPYQSLVGTNFTETALEDGTYFYILTTIMKNRESVMSSPGIVEVKLTKPPERIPGFNIYILLAILGISIIFLYKKNWR